MKRKYLIPLIIIIAIAIWLFLKANTQSHLIYNSQEVKRMEVDSLEVIAFEPIIDTLDSRLELLEAELYIDSIQLYDFGMEVLKNENHEDLIIEERSELSSKYKYITEEIHAVKDNRKQIENIGEQFLFYKNDLTALSQYMFYNKKQKSVDSFASKVKNQYNKLNANIVSYLRNKDSANSLKNEIDFISNFKETNNLKMTFILNCRDFYNIILDRDNVSTLDIKSKLISKINNIYKSFDSTYSNCLELKKTDSNNDLFIYLTQLKDCCIKESPLITIQSQNRLMREHIQDLKSDVDANKLKSLISIYFKSIITETKIYQNEVVALVDDINKAEIKVN